MDRLKRIEALLEYGILRYEQEQQLPDPIGERQQLLVGLGGVLWPKGLDAEHRANPMIHAGRVRG